MPRTKTSESDRKAGEEPSVPPAITAADVTVVRILSALEETRIEALKRGNTASAVTAILAMANFAGLLRDKSAHGAAPLPKFDGNYHEAARRIALLLRLGKEKPAKAAGKSTKRRSDKARDRPS
jgi:hypothetical protein